MGQPRPLFCLFSFFSNTNFTEKTVGVSQIWTWIVRVQGKHADNLTTTMAQPFWLFELPRNNNNLIFSWTLVIRTKVHFYFAINRKIYTYVLPNPYNQYLYPASLNFVSNNPSKNLSVKILEL